MTVIIFPKFSNSGLLTVMAVIFQKIPSRRDSICKHERTNLDYLVLRSSVITTEGAKSGYVFYSFLIKHSKHT